MRSTCAAFGRGDIPALLDLLTDDIEWTVDGSIGDAHMRAVHGKDDVTRWFGDVLAVDGIEACEPRQMLAGPDHVTVIGWERTKALPAGDTWESNWIHVWHLRRPRVCRFFGMLDTAAVAKARGLALA